MSNVPKKLSKKIRVAARLRKKLRMDTARHKATGSKGPQLKPKGVVEMSTYHMVAPDKLPDVAIGIITADRIGKPTIYPTMSSLRIAGFGQTLNIFTESQQITELKLKHRDQNIRVFPDKPAGCVPNWTRAATWLIQNTDSSWIMLMQDDVVWCSCGADLLYSTLNAIDYSSDGIRRYRLGVLSPYTSPAMVPANASGIGWTEAKFYGKTKGLWGALALCFPREALVMLLTNKRFKAHDKVRALDYVIGDTFRYHIEPPLGVKVHLPSLTQHIGDNSTIFSKMATKGNHLQQLRQGYKYVEDSAQWRQKR